MPFKEGDFLLIEHTAKVKETGKIFDTTREDVARSEGFHKEGEIYEPKLVVKTAVDSDKTDPIDLDLAKVIEAWPALRADTRAAVVAIVRGRRP